MMSHEEFEALISKGDLIRDLQANRFDRRTLLRLSAVGGASLFLASCSSSGGSSSSGKSGQLTVSQQADVDSLFPLSTDLTESRNIYGLMFDPLLRKDKNGKPTGVIAERWGRTSDTTWRFHLRKGLKFWDGSPVTADDVVFSLNYMRDPKKYVGASRLASWKDVIKVDEATVDVQTKTPDPLVLTAILDLSYVVSQKYITDHDEQYVATKPLGSGPYKLKEWTRSDHLTVVANEDYWEGTPTIKTVVYRPIPDANTRIAALTTGGVDFISSLDLSQIDRVNSSGSTVAVTAPDDRAWYIGLQMNQNKALADVRVRQAMNYAVDKEAILKRFFQGLGKPLNSPVFESEFGYPDTVAPYPYDPDKAKSLLSDAGYASGFTVSFDIADTWKDASLAASQYLSDVGIKVNNNVQDFNRFIDQMFKFQLGDLYTIAVHNPDLNAGTIYQETMLTNGSYNFNKFTDPQVDAWIKSATTTFDEEQQQTLYNQIGSRVHDLAPWLYLFNSNVAWGLRKGIQWKGRTDGVIDPYHDITL
jgi:peptide/nickel transport system substrate-binding protein